MSSIKILVNGARGRMGLEAVEAIENDPDLTLVGQTDLEDDLEIGRASCRERV